MKNIVENLVFVGEEGQKLRFIPSQQHSITLNGTQSDPITYEEHLDYIVDYDAREIKRTSDSRIPDWREHEAYGLDEFDHREFSNYRNSTYTCEVIYTAVEDASGAVVAAETEDGSNSPTLMEQLLPRLYAKLQQGDHIQYVVYGDSISAGYEATRPELDYPVRFVDALRNRFPNSSIHTHRKAVGGETSRGGLQKLSETVLPLAPDLITIGYGMNDQTKLADGRNAITVEEFEQNLLDMIRIIKERTESEVILLTPCLPNPRWIFASSNVTAYADAIRRVGQAAAIPVADVQRLWQAELEAGKTHESLLLNNLNHPNDYGHSLYFAALCGLLGM